MRATRTARRRVSRNGHVARPKRCPHGRRDPRQRAPPGAVERRWAAQALSRRTLQEAAAALRETCASARRQASRLTGDCSADRREAAGRRRESTRAGRAGTSVRRSPSCGANVERRTRPAAAQPQARIWRTHQKQPPGAIAQRLGSPSPLHRRSRLCFVVLLPMRALLPLGLLLHLRAQLHLRPRSATQRDAARRAYAGRPASSESGQRRQC